jgi:hypothetical protein
MNQDEASAKGNNQQPAAMPSLHLVNNFFAAVVAAAFLKCVNGPSASGMVSLVRIRCSDHVACIVVKKRKALSVENSSIFREESLL